MNDATDAIVELTIREKLNRMRKNEPIPLPTKIKCKVCGRERDLSKDAISQLILEAVKHDGVPFVTQGYLNGRCPEHLDEFHEDSPPFGELVNIHFIDYVKDTGENNASNPC